MQVPPTKIFITNGIHTLHSIHTNIKPQLLHFVFDIKEQLEVKPPLATLVPLASSHLMRSP